MRGQLGAAIPGQRFGQALWQLASRDEKTDEIHEFVTWADLLFVYRSATRNVLRVVSADCRGQ